MESKTGVSGPYKLGVLSRAPEPQINDVQINKDGSLVHTIVLGTEIRKD